MKANPQRDIFRRFGRASARYSSPINKTHIDRSGSGLHHAAGAFDVISLISSRHVVNKLILGNNELADDGCIALFKFLCSAPGRKYQIEEISMNYNGIGDGGLLAIAAYLKDNRSLRQLLLQNNVFDGEISVVRTFTSAVNTSHLQMLSLASNRTLSDSFIEEFLPELDSPYLKELHISAMDLSSRSLNPIIAYLSSTQRCRLHTLKCNGNALGRRAVNSIIQTIERSNFALLTAEFHANYAIEDDTSDNVDSEDSFSSASPWKESVQHLKNLLRRNAYLQGETQEQALNLLKYSRALLFHSMGGPISQQKQKTVSSETGTKSVPVFASLPVELQLHIFYFLAPMLSPAQRIRIYNHSLSPTTLPPLLPRLLDIGHPNNVIVHRGLNTNEGSFPKAGEGSRADSAGIYTAAGLSTGSLTRREHEKSNWLAAVGCDRYEQDADALR